MEGSMRDHPHAGARLHGSTGDRRYLNHLAAAVYRGSRRAEPKTRPLCSLNRCSQILVSSLARSSSQKHLG
jgi:hypothetical protein